MDTLLTLLGAVLGWNLDSVLGSATPDVFAIYRVLMKDGGEVPPPKY